MNAQTLVAKVWNFAHVLRDQGVSYQAYISQISYLLFLKMDEERVTQIGEASMLPKGARWEDIKASPARRSARRMPSCWRSCRSKAASSAQSS
ncbi:type I restriction-modification system subunit M N-terminal domain-containing protein [Bradyrhizobium manausense]|uniref:type I restriction-modification system subunit M N-terminal domain-containing protein n=1 Tax=Bradyrhizobium manausense TaxID=989370 RepID=UPI000A81BC4A|nr:type I restriction-modification system subunit M N-terminal domain-containing protein [Bradyrhizobium manausense]